MLGKGFLVSPKGRMWWRRKRRLLWIVGSPPGEESTPVAVPSQLRGGGDVFDRGDKHYKKHRKVN